MNIQVNLISADYLEPVCNGYDIGIMSEAGLPGIADPGAKIVALAHQKEDNGYSLIRSIINNYWH